MERVRFNDCLNKEIKFYNISIGALVGGGSIGGVAGLIKGLMWAFGAGAIGVFIGGWLGKQLWLGNVQRWTYWHLGAGMLLAGRVLPPSHKRHLV